MIIDPGMPKSRRALLLGALGGIAATVAGLMKAPTTLAGTDGDLALETTNNTDVLTELVGSSAPALRVVGGGVGLQAWGDIALDAFGDIAVNAISDATSAPASIGFNRGSSVGVLGWSADGNESTPTLPPKTGVFGLAEQDAGARGVLGKSGSGQGVRGEALTGIGVAGVIGPNPAPSTPAASWPGVEGYGPIGVIGFSDLLTGVIGVSDPTVPLTVSPKTGVYGIAAQDASSRGVLGETDSGVGVLGRASTGQGLRGESDSGPGVFATNNAASVGSIVAEGGPGTAVHGHGGGGNVPVSPPTTGIYGSAAGVATGVFGDATSGVGVRGWATTGDGMSAKATTGVGIRSVATSGEGVHGEATAGVGVKALATTGVALAVSGRATFSRSGLAMVSPKQSVVDVIVPGGLTGSPIVFAQLQLKRGNVHVLACRPNSPSAGKIRVTLSGVASTTAATPLAWLVLG